MDIPQLKLLAERIRALLQQSNHPVGHNQSLDLVAALPGLRNWPEVQAFPDRVAACELDRTSAGRLAFRLKKKFEMEVAPQDLLAAMTPPGTGRAECAPQIWPTGPAPGVYVTTSQAAIDALLERYEEATDGALVYAERAGNHKESSIDLGETGLWSSGLSRVSSGTLIVIGPLELDQQSWDDSASRLEVACVNAQSSGHRIAVLFDTPTPQALCEDVLLMVRSRQPNGTNGQAALAGLVTEDGELQRCDPFAKHRPQPVPIRSVATVDAIPQAALAPLQQALEERTSGLLILGSGIIGEHWAIDLVASGLAMTEHAGPAARIMPRHRSTPAKDWQVPDGIKQLPFLPSIESAYDQGYRRMVFNPSYTDAGTLLEYGKDVLFIAGAYASDVTDAFMSAVRGHSLREESDLLALVIALLSVTPVPTKQGDAAVTDLFVMCQAATPVKPMELEDIFGFLQENRVLRLDEQLSRLLDSGETSVAGLKGALARNRSVNQFLSQRSDSKQAPSAR